MKPFLLAAAFALVSTGALAQTFELTIKNGYTDAVTGLSVGGGKIEAFKQVPAAGKRTFSITLPDGKCEARLLVTFANGQSYDAGKFDFCKYDLLDLWFE